MRFWWDVRMKMGGRSEAFFQDVRVKIGWLLRRNLNGCPGGNRWEFWVKFGWTSEAEVDGCRRDFGGM